MFVSCMFGNFLGKCGMMFVSSDSVVLVEFRIMMLVGCWLIWMMFCVLLMKLFGVVCSRCIVCYVCCGLVVYVVLNVCCSVVVLRFLLISMKWFVWVLLFC